MKRRDPFYGQSRTQGYNVIIRRLERKRREAERASAKQTARSSASSAPLQPAPAHKRTPSRRSSGSRVWILVSAVLVVLLIIVSSIAISQSHTSTSPVSSGQHTPTPRPSPTPKPLCAHPNQQPHQEGVTWKRVKENQALVVETLDGAYQVVALFASQQELNCWAAKFPDLRRTMKLVPGHELLVLEESGDPKYSNIRPGGSWALVITSGPDVMINVMSSTDAHTKMQNYYDNGAITWLVNYRLTHLGDSKPA